MGYGRNPYQAVQDFRTTLQRSLSCVTPSVIAVRGTTYEVGSEHALILGVPETVKLSGSDVALSVRIYARIVERGEGTPYRAYLTSYFYTLADLEGREILTYHTKSV